MRALVITEFPPMVEGFEARGNYRRFCLFMAALRDIVDTVEIFHLWPGKDRNLKKINVAQSERFGLPVLTHIIERHTRPHNLINDYLSGILSVYEQDEFFAFCGPEQANKAG